MENHLQTMQDEVDAMEQMFSTPAKEDTLAPTEEAHSDPTADTLDGMIEDVQEHKQEEDEVPVEETKKTKRTNWKSRYTKYRQTTDATIYELRKENANYISQIQSLSTKIEEMNYRLTTVDHTSFSDKFTDIDKEIFGEDALASLEKATNDAVNPLKEQLAEEKEWRKQQLELQRTKNSQDANTFFLKSLAKEVPDYAEIDVDPAFIKYMDLPDNVSGIPRVNLFRQAQAIGDVARVAHFMTEFQEANAPMDNLKHKVTPVSTSTASPAYTQDGKMSMSEINKYYDDVLKGKYRSNEKARVEMENKVNTALGNGDVY